MQCSAHEAKGLEPQLSRLPTGVCPTPLLAEHCPHCLKALRGVRAAGAGLLGAAGVAFLGLAYTWGHGAAVAAPASLALLAGLAASLALRSKVKDLEQAFIFTDWRHSEHH